MTQEQFNPAWQMPIDLSGRAKHDLMAQFAALCWRMKGGRMQVCLVTSRTHRRWIIPKGWPMHQRTPAEAAAIEAWEEAGLRGDVSATPLGSYQTVKLMRGGPLMCDMIVYPLRVTKVCDRWPEMHQRSRKWFTVKKAAAKVEHRALKQLIKALGKTAH